MKLWSILYLFLTVSGIASCAGEIPGHSGIYAVIRGGSVDRVEAAAKLPYIDGFTLYLGVRALVPEKGVYDWSRVDRVIKAARDNGKKVNLGFLPGRWVPDWFYAEGVQKFRWIHETDLVDPGRHDAAAPVPWDPKLLELLGEICREAGERYAGDPAVVSVQVTGPALANGLETNFNVRPAEAEAVGYTPEKLISAWQTMFDATAAAFPNQRLSWCIHDMFPNGRDAKPGRAIRDWAYRKYGSRLHLLACYLTHEPWFRRGNQAVDIWAERNAEIPAGLQLINIYAIRKYTPEQLEQALRTGIREGADYLEIFIEELSDPACAAAVEKVRNDWKGMQK